MYEPGQVSLEHRLLHTKIMVFSRGNGEKSEAQPDLGCCGPAYLQYKSGEWKRVTCLGRRSHIRQRLFVVPDQETPEGAGYRFYPTEFIYWLVSESQVPQKIVNLLLTLTNQNHQ